MASKQIVYVAVPVSYTDPSGKPISEVRLLRVPDELVLLDFASFSPALLATFERVDIDPATLSTSCGINFTPPTPTPDPGTNPGYSLLLPDQEPGGSYSVIISAVNLVNLPTGSKPLRVVILNKALPYLGLVNENVFPAQLTGTIPANAQAGTISLRTYLDPPSAGYVDGTFPVGVKAVEGLYGVLQPNGQGLFARVGPDSTNDTTIQAVVYPTGFTQTDTYSMNHSASGDAFDGLAGKRTFFTWPGTGVVAGRYVFAVKRAGVTVYFVHTQQPSNDGQTITITTFYTAIPEPGDEIGTMDVVVNADHTVSLSVVASKQVLITPPYLKGGTATAYVDMTKGGGAYRRNTAALTPGSYVGMYKLAGSSTEYGYGFAIDKTTVLAIDRIDTDNGQTTELLAKASFGDGVQFQQATYLDNGTLGDFTDWADMGSKVDTGGYQYTVLGGYQSGKLYKKRYQFRPTTNSTAIIALDVQQLAGNQNRRTIYPAGTAPASNDGNLSETFTYSNSAQ